MFAALKALLSKWIEPLTGSEPKKENRTSSTDVASQEIDVEPRNHVSDSDKGRTFSDLVPYDENLLERSRTQWQFGDWDSLAELNRETLQHHPDRAKLALLAAAGKMQKNQMPEARQLIQLAQDWGVSRKLVTQILASGVHNSLACASSLAGQHDRATQHFESSIALGAPGSDGRLLGRARMSEQLQQLNLPYQTKIDHTNKEVRSSALPVTSITQDFQSLSQTLIEQKEGMETQLKFQADEMIKMRKFLDASMKKEVANIARQIEATIGLQSYFATGELPNVNAERHSWPISPDFAIYLIELIELNDYDFIIEFGSGISTVIIAKALVKQVERRVGRNPVEFISFDHLDKYYQRTRDQLRHAGLIDSVDVRLSPLQDWQGHDAVVQPYYGCEPILEALAKQKRITELKILVVVDGPPAATGKHARYPAGPILLKYFGKAAQLDILLDDYIRDEEKEIAKRWQTEIEAADLTFETEIRSLEKDACLIRITNTVPQNSI